MPPPPFIAVCRCAFGGVFPDDRAQVVIRALGEACLAPVVVPDLCGMAARREAALAEWVRRPGLRIVACHPRAVAGLFEAADLALPGRGAEVINLRERSCAEALDELGVRGPQGLPTSGDDPPAFGLQTTASDWFPWFPVIDRRRCTACRQCADFCLFGVYVVESDRVEVRNPSNCKTHCPACARICPQAAIMFPKHGEAPINGAEITDEEAEQARVRHDLHALLGDDIAAALAERKRRARARLIDPEKLRQARADRARFAAPAPRGNSVRTLEGEGPP